MWIQEGTFKCADLQNWILRICTYWRTFLNSGTILFVPLKYSRVLRPYVWKIFSPFIVGYRAHNNYNVQYRNTWHSHLIQKRAWLYLPTLLYHISLISAQIYLILGAFVFPNWPWGISNLNDAQQRLFFVAVKVIVARPVVTCCGRLACYVA